VGEVEQLYMYFINVFYYNGQYGVFF
jgi:hypothetical protein